MERWQRWAPVFDPWRAVGVDQVSALYQPRLRVPHEAIARRLGRVPVGAAAFGAGAKMVVVGSRGSGKSTELAALAHLVRDRFLSVRLDLSGAFGAASTVLDVLVLLAAAVERTSRDWSLERTASRDELVSAVERVGLTADAFGTLVMALEPVTVVLGHAGAATVAGSLLRVLGSVAKGALGALQREGAAGDRAAFVGALNRAIVDLRVIGANEHPALFLLEGLDKLTDLETIRSAFRDVDLLMEVDAPIVLTAPVAVRHQPWVNAGRLQKFDLWNAAVVHRDGTPNEDGVNELIGMFEKRIAADGAPPDLVAGSALQTAAVFSSGNAREFFRLLYDAMDRADQLAAEQVVTEHVNDAIHQRRHELQIALRSDQLEVLSSLLASPGPLPPGPEGDELLYENYIACYPNEDAWFRPNQILVPYLERLRGEG